MPTLPLPFVQSSKQWQLKISDQRGDNNDGLIATDIRQSQVYHDGNEVVMGSAQGTIHPTSLPTSLCLSFANVLLRIVIILSL